MAATSRAQQNLKKSATAVRIVSMSFKNEIDEGELLTGSPTVVASPSDLTITNKVINASSVVVNGITVEAGLVVQFLVSGGTAGTRYLVTVTCGTDSSPAETVDGEVILDVV